MSKFKDTVKYLFFTAYLVGSLPRPYFALETFGYEASPNSLKVKLAWLYSFVYLAGYLATTVTCTPAFARSMEVPDVSHFSGTNLTAFRIYINLAVYFAMVIIAIGITRAGKLRRLIQSVADYDDEFHLSNNTRLVTPSFAILGCSLLVSMLLEAVGSYLSMSIVWKGQRRPCFGMSLLSGIDFTTRLLTVVVIPHTISKVGVLVLLESVIIMTKALSNRITDLAGDIPRAFSTAIDIPSWHMASDRQGADRFTMLHKFNLRLKRLKLISVQLEEWTGLIVLTVVTVKIVELINSIYLGTVAFLTILYMDFELETLTALVPPMVDCVIVITIAEAGQKLVKAETILREVVCSVDLHLIENDAMRHQLISFQNKIQQSRFRLSACGFCNVHRKFLASMVGPLATFVVVLGQLRLSDA